MSLQCKGKSYLLPRASGIVIEEHGIETNLYYRLYIYNFTNYFICFINWCLRTLIFLFCSNLHPSNVFAIGPALCCQCLSVGEVSSTDASIQDVVWLDLHTMGSQSPSLSRVYFSLCRQAFNVPTATLVTQFEAVRHHAHKSFSSNSW